MTELVKVVVYYGPGNVRSNHMGVDLGEFQCMEDTLANPETVSISQVQEYFTVNFSLNPEICTVSVQSLWPTSSESNIWELRTIDRTKKWVTWLRACKVRHIQPVLLVLPAVKSIPTSHSDIGYDPSQGYDEQNEMDMSMSGSGSYVGGGGFENGQSSQPAGGEYSGETGQTSQSAGDEYSGEADGDEEDGHLQRLMDEEDEDGLADNIDSDDSDDSGEEDDEDSEDEVPIPDAWNQDYTEVMNVRDQHDSNWEYHENNITKGALYPSKKHLKEAITKWAMSTQRVLKTVVSSQKYLTMECTNVGCEARVHGYAPKYDVNWKVSDFVPHTCRIKNMLGDHRNLSSTLVAQLLHTEIVEGQAMGVKAIINKVKVSLNYTISYDKAWRAKQRALEDRFGSFLDAYDCVVRLLRTLQERNPGTYVDIQHFYLPDYVPNVKVLHRVFFSFGVCIEAFSHCRPVICVDGTFLTGKYRGQILTAIGTDGNNQIVPLAFAFVKGENTDSWLWFFRQLKLAIVKERPNVCILHDRHAGILKAIKTLKEAAVDEPTPWPDMQSRWCMHHLGANFFSQFKNKDLMNLFKKLCKQNQEFKYTKLRKILNDFTKKQVRERKAARAAAVLVHAATLGVEGSTEADPVGLCDLPGFDPPGTRRKPGQRIKNFEEWIEHEPVERWSLLHDTHGARYGTMTTNLAEVYNFVLRGSRALPLTAIVEGVFLGTVKYFKERRVLAQLHAIRNPQSPYCDKITKYMEKKMQKAQKHSVYAVGNEERRFEVRLPSNKFGIGNAVRTHEVRIGNEARPTCECTCNKPKLLHLPCSHVLAACSQLQMDTISFVSDYYLKEAVISTWTGEMMGFRAMGNFNKIEGNRREYMPDPNLLRTGTGRRQSRRIRNDMDVSEAGGPTRQCFLCNEFGHWDTCCPKYGTGGATLRGRGRRGGRRGRRG